MIRTLFHAPGRPLRTDVLAEEFQHLLQVDGGVLWVDFDGEPPEVCEPILRGFGFHHLPIDDALRQTHVPKVDDWGEYLYIVLNALLRTEHPTHLSIPEAIDVARSIGAQRTFLTHLTHGNFHANLETELPAGIIPAFDGLVVRVD